MTERQQPLAVPGYALGRVIGEGASGVVWSGTGPGGRPVAVKVPHLRADASDLAQARVEQHVLRAVRHEHLVPLRDAVALHDGRTALVFDLVPGQALAGIVRSRGRLRAGETVTVLTPICEAVAAIHSAGGLHGDLSPGNVMVTPAGRPVLLDLGSTRVVGAEPGLVHGTPGFVAPEIRAGDEPSMATDVYSLGALAWFCATGNGAPDTPLRLDPEVIESHVGPALAGLISACIDPDPACRPTSAELPRRFFDAAVPEPVEVVLDLDPAAALTHRLRETAGHDAVGPDAVAARDRGSWKWLTRSGVAAAAALTLVAAAGWALAARVPPGATTPGSVPTGRPVARAAAATVGGLGTPSARSGARRGDQVVSAPGSPSVRPFALLQALSDRRGRALVRRDTVALAAVHADGSPSALADQQLVASMRESGTHWEGLRSQVADAKFVSGTGRMAVVRARVSWAAYVVVDSGGVRHQRAAERGDLLDFRLQWGAAGWRIVSISAARAS
ncbi:protein kinase domain-containing protein [Monashia sp. NPDC004114]